MYYSAVLMMIDDIKDYPGLMRLRSSSLYWDVDSDVFLISNKSNMMRPIVELEIKKFEGDYDALLMMGDKDYCPNKNYLLKAYQMIRPYYIWCAIGCTNGAQAEYWDSNHLDCRPFHIPQKAVWAGGGEQINND